MRLWHKDLILTLPRQQLISQWRECCCIARNIHDNGTPNHILVNKIMEYSSNHFYTYARKVHRSMKLRQYKCDFEKFLKWYPDGNLINNDELFTDWHNERYFLQCYYNLQEKYDCGGISEKEWALIEERMKNYTLERRTL